MDTIPKDFLSLSLKELEKRNLKAKKERADRSKINDEEIEKKYKKYLKEEETIKAVTIFFSDLEGRFHMIDYDKKYLLDASNNLTFDGSSVRGFSNVNESDLRLKPDWASFYWLPAEIFGPGKIALFADIYTKENKIHP
ncbi:MAG: glutamine synthetase, partial [Bacillota bacterium]|nr:glutamine synthetase [Bacillota bacterium]